MGDSTYHNLDTMKFINSQNAPNNSIGSIFGEGSLTMVIAILALVASIAAIGISIASGKQKAVTAPTPTETDN